MRLEPLVLILILLLSLWLQRRKIIAKVFSIHLNEVLQGTILENKNAFIARRQNLDVALVTNEVVDDKRKRSKHCIVFKLDFEKANYRVSWSFLDKLTWCQRERGLVLNQETRFQVVLQQVLFR